MLGIMPQVVIVQIFGVRLLLSPVYPVEQVFLSGWEVFEVVVPSR